MADLTKDELLDVLMEEAAEIIVAGSKIKRFGWVGSHEEYGPNHLALAGEVGDFLGVLDGLLAHLDQVRIQMRRDAKLEKVLAMRTLHVQRMANGHGHEMKDAPHG